MILVGSGAGGFIVLVVGLAAMAGLTKMEVLGAAARRPVAITAFSALDIMMRWKDDNRN